MGIYKTKDEIPRLLMSLISQHLGWRNIPLDWRCLEMEPGGAGLGGLQ